MTEEIIVNGVDVSGCEGYKDKHCRYETSIMFTEDNLCSNFSNCYYRQLKRLELENKKLKEKLELNEIKHQRYRECSIQLNNKYKQALEEIKNICKPVLKANTIEKLEGKHLTGKYNLAKEIMEVLKDEKER